MPIPGICMGCPTHLRNVLCLPLKELKTLYHICKFPAYKQGLFLLKLKVSLIVRDNELDLQNVHESPKIEHLLFRNKRNLQTPEGKEKWLIARHEYEKRRTVNESEESKEKRLVQQHLNRRKKHANESSESRKKKLATQSQCQRQKIANESAECREERMLIKQMSISEWKNCEWIHGM